LEEFNVWLSSAKSFQEVPKDFWDDPAYMEWSRELGSKTKSESEFLWVKKDLFDSDGKLKALSQASWNEEWVRSERRKIQKPSDISDDDDIPF
jgi:hypothetical protein